MGSHHGGKSSGWKGNYPVVICPDTLLCIILFCADKVANRLHLAKVMCQMSTSGVPPHVAAHIPGNKVSDHGRKSRTGWGGGGGSPRACFWKIDQKNLRPQKNLCRSLLHFERDSYVEIMKEERTYTEIVGG